MLYILRKNIAAITALLLFLTTTHLATAQTQSDKKKSKPDPDTEASQLAAELATLQQYLDKNGGYKNKKGGYYNPKAGTYTDEKGGVVDNWSGYTYTDGSYKSGLGDFWDEPNKTWKLADGRVAKSPDTTSKEAIRLLRQNVEENDGYDKNLTLRGMIESIKIDHPGAGAKIQKHP